MRSVIIGSYDTAEDFGLILTEKKVDPPTAKTVSVAIDGRDGDLDLSEALTGDIKYNNREASFSFLLAEGTRSEREITLDTITNSIHGKKYNLILPDDQDHYFVGRCEVKDVHNDKAYGSLSISATCEPWRYSSEETSRSVNVTATPIDFVLRNNGRKTVSPTLTVTGNVTLVYGTTTVALSDGTYKLASLLLPTGTTTVRLSGSGRITFTYREAVI